ncbi:MAG TPA: hypothetical protein PLE30_06220 [Candidatus Kapabacteria bacterium]|nr:hypothetical protein [Candidatus Kapabacteria bacterium]
MLSKFSILIFVFYILSFIYASANGIGKNILSYKASIDKYYFSFNYKKLESLKLELSNEPAHNNDDKFLTNYYQGIINYCLGRIYYNYDKDKANKRFEEALDNFLICDNIKTDVEITAMISATYGKLSSLSILKVFVYGLKAKDYIEKAYKMNPYAPKVLIIAATHLMHIPEFYGGDKSKARELLNNILSYKESKDSVRIDWANYAEAFAYLAQLEILESNISKAKVYMQKALDRIPDYGFVKYDLAKQIKAKE